MVLHESYLKHSKGIIPLSQIPKQIRRFGSYLLPRSSGRWVTRKSPRKSMTQTGLEQGWRTCDTRAQNGTLHPLLSQFSFIIIFPNQSLYTVQNMCKYTHIWLCTDCIWFTVATKQHCSETFEHKSERCKVLTGYLSLGRRPGGDWANTWHWTERFSLLLNRSSRSHSLFLSHSSRRLYYK